MNKAKERLRKLTWLGPVLMLIGAALVFMLLGLTLFSAMLAAFLLVCPVIIIYGLIKAFRRPIEIPLEKPPETRGMSLEWIAPVYDFYCPKIGLGSAFRSKTLIYAALKPGENVLDVGCGTGVLTRLAAEAVGPEGRAIGIDPGPRMIGLARKGAAIERSRARFRLAAMEGLPFEDNSFDCVLSSLMIHHLPPDLKSKGLSEAYRVLKPGGCLLAVDVGRPTNPLWWIFVWPLRFWSNTKDHFAGRLDGYFLKAGFSRVDLIGHWMGLLSFWFACKKQDK